MTIYASKRNRGDSETLVQRPKDFISKKREVISNRDEACTSLLKVIRNCYLEM